MNAHPPVSIHILNYNGGPDIIRCLESLERLEYPNFQIIVIDNASVDGSLSEIEKRFPRVRLICHETNLGFGGGHNSALACAKRAGAEFIWFFNQDAVSAPDTLTLLVGALRKSPHASATSPLIFTPDQCVWFAGGRINWFRMRAIHDTPRNLPVIPYETGYLTGCALFVRRTSLEKVGPFDEHFFLYYEDADLSLRMKRAGYQLLVAPDARVWHAETSGKTLPRKVYWLVHSGLLFFHRYTPPYWRLWHALFLPLRRFKNRLDIRFRPNPINRAVHQAYEDWFSSAL